MKKYLPYIVGGAAFIALYFMARGSAAKKLIINFKDIVVGKIEGVKIPDIFIRFNVINPTSTPLSVTSIAGQIFLNGYLFTTVQNLEKVSIPGNTNTIYQVKVLPPGLTALLAIYKLIRNKQNADIEFRGTINTTGVTLPINESVNVKLWK
jgi:LEA14-like dessication related protein